MKPALIVVNEHRSGDVHCVDKNEPFPYAAFTKTFLDLLRDIDEGQACWGIEPQLFAITFQAGFSLFLRTRLASSGQEFSVREALIRCISPREKI
jgi:hypothetical protein